MFRSRPMSPDEMGFLIDQRYGTGLDVGDRIAAIALRHGEKAEPCDHGFFTVKRIGRTGKLLVLTDRERDASSDRPAQLARRAPVRYSRSSTDNATDMRRSTMPRGQRAAAAAPARGRGRQAAAEPEPEENGAKDYTTYRDKEPTPKMVAFADWIIDEVYEGEFTKDDADDMDGAFREGVRLGGTLRMEFQKSDVNQAMLEEARAAREAEEAEEAEPEPAPARGRRGAAKPAAPAAKRGRTKAAAEPEPDEGDEDGDEDEDQEPEPAPARRRTGKAASQPAGRAADRPAPARRSRGRTAEAPY